jgi:catechol 2,3-dioxygenase-like lactoylglutathione lyase family enzyme
MMKYTTVLYVADVPASVSFYRKRLGLEPVENHPNFAMFALPSGGLIGLWTQADVKPETPPGSAGHEMLVPVADRAAVEATHADWSAAGVTIAQPPVSLDFGHSFVALDPDGHRLRVCYLFEM